MTHANLKCIIPTYHTIYSIKSPTPVILQTTKIFLQFFIASIIFPRRVFMMKTPPLFIIQLLILQFLFELNHTKLLQNSTLSPPGAFSQSIYFFLQFNALVLFFPTREPNRGSKKKRGNLCQLSSYRNIFTLEVCLVHPKNICVDICLNSVLDWIQ